MQLTNKAGILCFLQILKEYSDDKHILSMKFIKDKMEKEYGIPTDRRTIYGFVDCLNQMGYVVNTPSQNGRGYYLESREFAVNEIKLLMDAVYSLQYLSKRDTKKLIAKLQNQLSVHERKNYEKLMSISVTKKTLNTNVFENIDILTKAILQKKQVSFIYCEYGMDKKLHPRKDEPVVVSPYEMICQNKHYYLVNIRSGHSDLSLYRIDYMEDITILEEDVAVDPKELNFSEAELASYAYSGKPEKIEMIVDRKSIGHVIDEFGNNMSITPIPNDETKCHISIVVPPQGVKFWALQFIEHVKIISPESLRQDIDNAINKYQKI